HEDVAPGQLVPGAVGARHDEAGAGDGGGDRGGGGEPVARVGDVVDPHLVPGRVAAVDLDRARRLQLALVEERPEDVGHARVEPGDRQDPGAEPAGRRLALEAELAGAEVAGPGPWPGRGAPAAARRPAGGHARL